jgi:hypothetical protein
MLFLCVTILYSLISVNIWPIQLGDSDMEFEITETNGCKLLKKSSMQMQCYHFTL